jgi:iron complex outermembrane receptor protein
MNTDDEIKTLQNNVFTEWQLNLPSDYSIVAGASCNLVDFNIADGLAYPGNTSHLSQAGNKVFDPVITPRVSLLKTFNDKLSVYANVSQGYTPPGTSMVVIPYLGKVNTDLKPETATLYEAGSKGTLFGNHLQYQLALFKMNVTDKITPQTVTDAKGAILYTFYTNVGKQINDGLETSLAYSMEREGRFISLIRPFVAYTYSYFTYQDFKSDNNNNAKTVNYTGFRVSGVPPHMINAGIDMATKWGLSLNTTLRYVDAMPVTYTNTVRANTFALLDGKLGYEKPVGEHFLLSVFAGANNLTNSTYYTMVYINSSNAGLFIPGPYTATFYSGFNFSYKF